MTTRNIKISLQYDGTNYCGWQIQHNGTSIQGLLTEIVSRIEERKVTIHGAGRTDAGVHALNQVANFSMEKPLDCHKILRAINGSLPFDIRVSAVTEMPADFHARFSAIGKEYRYQIALGPLVNPFEYRYFHHCPHKLDLAAMIEAANYLIGTHDFSAFATAIQADSTIRTITAIDWTLAGDKLFCQISGTGFLRYMVRTIVGTLLEVGRAKRSPEDIPKILLSKDRRQAGATAPACGLFLVNVCY